nr:hypothetical protein [Candidatus Sigynarchaeota archaeon]
MASTQRKRRSSSSEIRALRTPQLRQLGIDYDELEHVYDASWKAQIDAKYPANAEYSWLPQLHWWRGAASRS